MDAIQALIHGLPGEVDSIRRRYWRDPKFRAVCEDYRDSLEAAARFGSADPPRPARAQEYRQLASELLAEAAAMLKGDQK